MAISKATSLPNGFTASYWRFSRFQNLTPDGQGSYVMALYKDRDTAVNNGSPLEERGYYISIPKEVLVNDNVYDYVYSKAKEEPDFAGATDILEQGQVVE